MTLHDETARRTAREAADRSGRQRSRHPAAAGRALAAGVSASAAIGLGGLMFHDARVAEPSGHRVSAAAVQLDPVTSPTADVPRPVVAAPPPPDVPTSAESRASR